MPKLNTFPLPSLHIPFPLPKNWGLEVVAHFLAGKGGGVITAVANCLPGWPRVLQEKMRYQTKRLHGVIGMQLPLPFATN
jgi:hypothetical protein